MAGDQLKELKRLQKGNQQLRREASDQAPFFDACALGASDAFRGYTATEFIDKALLSVQTEYR